MGLYERPLEERVGEERLVTEGPRSPWAGMRLGSLRARYREEYAELQAGARGQGEFP